MEGFYSLKEAHVLILRWRHEYITIRPHSDLGTACLRRNRFCGWPSGATPWRIAPLRFARLHDARSGVNQEHRLWYEP